MEVSRDFIEGFRITRTEHGLIIEATDYHARPLRLTRKDLGDLGIRLVGTSGFPAETAEEKPEARDREVES